MENNYLCKRYHVVWFLICLFVVLVAVANQVVHPLFGMVVQIAFSFIIHADVKLVKEMERIEARSRAKVQRVNNWV